MELPADFLSLGRGSVNLVSEHSIRKLKILGDLIPCQFGIRAEVYNKLRFAEI